MNKLFLVPVLVVAAYAAARIWAPDDETALWVHRIAPATAEIIAALGCFAAAMKFATGDYLRRAWSLAGLGYLLLAGGALQGTAVAAGVPLTRAFLTIAANVAGVAGYLLFARTWQVAGLEDAEDARRRRRWLVASIVLSLVLAGPGLLLGGYATIEREVGFGLTVFFGALGDMVGLAIIAPVAMNALALRGGRLAWPWALMTASLVCWLLFSAQSLVAIIGGLDQDYTWMHAGAEVFRLLACTLLFCAAMFQRQAMSD